MKTWVIEIQQNGGEYTGFAYITATSVEQINEKTVIADGIEIQFDENIEIV